MLAQVVLKEVNIEINLIALRCTLNKIKSWCVDSFIERDRCFNREVGPERKNGSHFVFPPPSIFIPHFSRPPFEWEMQSDIIKCSESLSFTLHGVRGNFKTRMGIRSCHAAPGRLSRRNHLSKERPDCFAFQKFCSLSLCLGNITRRRWKYQICPLGVLAPVKTDISINLYDPSVWGEG